METRAVRIDRCRLRASRSPMRGWLAFRRVMGVFAKLEGPIDVDAIDEQPADLVFMLLAPDEGGVDHLKSVWRGCHAPSGVQSFETNCAAPGNVRRLYVLLLTDDFERR